MEKENKTVFETVTQTIKNAIGDETETVLPPADVMRGGVPSSEVINGAYTEEIKAYTASPTAPCDKKKALKLLKSFYNKDFRTFWTSDTAEYLPAVSEGTMKLSEDIRAHDEAIAYASDMISALSPKELAKDFLYGVANNAPEYRTALVSYYYIKNLPDHQFQSSYAGSVNGKDGKWEDRYSTSLCEICRHKHKLSSEPKMRFWHINMSMAAFYLAGRAQINLNGAIIHLEEYKKLPRPKHSIDDYECFMQMIKVIEDSPENTTSGKLRTVLKGSGTLTMTVKQIEAFIDILGYLNILHPDDCFGVTAGHTCKCDQLPSLSDMSYADYPVNRWTRKCGIDYDSISMLFDGIYG